MPKKKAAQTTKQSNASNKSTKTDKSTKKTVKKQDKATTKSLENSTNKTTEKNNKTTSKEQKKQTRNWATILVLILIFNLGVLFYAIHTNIMLQEQYAQLAKQVVSDKKEEVSNAYENMNKSNPLAKTSWRLIELGDKQLEKNQLVSLNFENNVAFSGFNSCNNYSGTYALNGEKIEFGEVAETMMACIPENMALAQEFNKALENTKSYMIQDGYLTLYDNDGNKTAVFIAFDDKTLSGTSWEVTAINNGNSGVVSTASDTYVSLMFKDDGTVKGSAGCNDYSGSYTYDPENLTIEIGPLASTKKYCATPENMMAQEQNFLMALQKAKTYKIQIGKLELRDENGSLQIAAKLALE